MSKLQKQVLLLTLIGFLLLVVRYFITNDFGYYFLIWNLLLAFLPLLFAVAATAYKKLRYLALVLWVLFYPNAPYLVTDYIHIRSANTLWLRLFDFLIVTVFAVVSLILGIRSLQIILNSPFLKKVNKYITVGIISALTSIGVYIGRILRFNSWDSFLIPHKIVSDFIQTLLEKSTLYSSLALLITIFVLNISVYVVMEKALPLNSKKARRK